MDIYDFALEKEQKSEKLYRQIADQCKNTGLKNIFTMLADEEQKHYNIVKKLQENDTSQRTETSIISDAKKVFERMRDERLTVGCNEKQIDTYREAQRFEEESRDYYKEKAEQVDDDYQQNLFQKLAREEQCHYDLLDGIIQMVQRPERWLEDAEWYHLEEY